MHKVLAALTALLFTATAALADDIVVYRGTVRFVLDAQTATTIPPNVKVYYVLNYTDGSLVQILYYNKLGKKKSVGSSQVRITRVILPNAKNATILTTGGASNDAENDFNFNAFLARGVDVALLIETTPARRTIERPRSFIADSLFINANPGNPSTMQDATLHFTVDVPKTLAANNENQTVGQVSDAIAEILTAQGYQ